MSLIYTKGDVTEAKEDIIMHGCNAQGVMGSGVARLIRNKYPKAYIGYLRQHEIDGLKLGYFYSFQDNGKLIVNAITQEYYGRLGKRYVSYDAVDDVMQMINVHYRGKRIALPRIGAGLGGGDWKVIESIIKHRCRNVDMVVYDYE